MFEFITNTVKKVVNFVAGVVVGTAVIALGAAAAAFGFCTVLASAITACVSWVLPKGPVRTILEAIVFVVLLVVLLGALFTPVAIGLFFVLVFLAVVGAIKNLFV